MRTTPLLLLAAAAALTTAATARAAPAPTAQATTAPKASAPAAAIGEASADLDGDGRPERARLEADGALRVVDAAGQERARVALGAPAAGPGSAGGVQIVTLSDGGPVAHAWVRRGAGARDEVVAALRGGALEVLVRERTGAISEGDRTIVLTVGPDGIGRHQRAPTVARCDGEARLYPERWDAAAQRFVPVVPPLPSVAATELAPSTTPPAGLAPWPRGAFHVAAASTDASAEGARRADLVGAPTELEDRDARTVWRADGAARGRGEWVAARATDDRRKVVAVRLMLPTGAPPKRLLVELARGSGPTAAVTTYAVAPPAAGGALWVVPPSPQPASCVAVIVAEPPAEGPSMIGELSIFTDADGADAIGALIAEAAGDGPGAEAAERLLAAERGPAAATRVAEAMATAVGGGRRRLVRVLTAQAEPSTAPALGRALTVAAKEERRLVVQALARLGAAGIDEAAKLLGDRGAPEEARADAAAVLAIAGGALGGGDAGRRAMAALVAAAGSGGGEELVRARRAALVAIARAPARLDELGSALAPSGPAGSSPARRWAAVGELGRALGLAAGAHSDEGRRRAAQALVDALGLATTTDGEADPARVAATLQLLSALRDLPTVEAAPLLARLRASSPVAPIRRGAVQAIAALPREAEPRARLLAEALSDADPAARHAAVEGIAKGGAAASATLAKVLRADRWPLVRRAAAERLADACTPAGDAALAETLGGDRPGDASDEVLRAALVTVAKCAPSSPLVTRVLEGRGQPISVRATAAALVARSAPPGGAAALARVLQDVLSTPERADRGRTLAVACARGLGRLGDRSTPILEALASAINEPTLPEVRAAGFEALGLLCPPEAPPALRRGLEDPEPAVRRAASEAARRCQQTPAAK
jgi:HEAT repeat protein